MFETAGGIQFVYLGKGNQKDPYYWEAKAELEGLQSRWPQNVRYIGKYSTEEQIAVFNALDIFTYPSEFEPFGTKPIVALINGML